MNLPLQGDVLPPDVVLCWFDIFLPIYPEIHLHKVYSPLVLCIFQNCGEFFHPKLPIDKNDIPYVPRLSKKIKMKKKFYLLLMLLFDGPGQMQWASILGQAWVLEIPLNYLQLVSPKIFGLPWYVTNATCIFFIQGTIK